MTIEYLVEVSLLRGCTLKFTLKLVKVIRTVKIKLLTELKPKLIENFRDIFEECPRLFDDFFKECFYIYRGKKILERLVSARFFYRSNFPALFSILFRTEKNAGNFNL